MLSLPHGCTCSSPSVFPKNWKTQNASVKKDWYIQYRFYDPCGPSGQPTSRQVFVKGMNGLKSIQERREATQILLDHELHKLRVEGYNPISRLSRPDTGTADEISIFMPFLEALTEAQKRLKSGRRTKECLRTIMNYLPKAAQVIGLAMVPISRVRRKDLVLLLEKCGQIKKTWSANSFNFYRAHLMMLYKVLLKYEAVELNLVEGIDKEVVSRRIRPTLTDDQRSKIDNHLRSTTYSFWRFMHIFFHSGARESELLRLQGKHVDIAGQRFRTVILKGKAATEVDRTIKDVAIPLWKEIMATCGPDDFLFSRGLVPGGSSIRPDQITRRWRKYVKKPLGIKADFYSLKHLNTSETVDRLNEHDAAAQNAHTSTAMVINIYDVKRKERQHERLKKVDNAFSSPAV
ncbi:MAG: hypothetical protein H7Y42_07710 [Chitinophagaceae bacterium]|nr:hypothetical protein [Chitinophagaceae bacterium]